MGIENRVTIITGATGGLGRIVTQRFAEQGARLALFGRDAERLDRMAQDLRLSEDRCLTRGLDLSDPNAAQTAATATLEKFGRAEILLHLVGGWTGGKSVGEVAANDVSEMLQQHLWTTFYLMQAFVPHLVANRWGRVMVVSSPHASNPPAKSAPYAIGKAAEEALILTAAKEVKDFGVTANVLLVRTIDAQHERERERTTKNAAWTTPEEIAAMILFLCSDEAEVVNGARIPLYGST